MLLSQKSPSTLENLADYHFDLIINPTGWLDCDIIQQPHVLWQLENPAISGFERRHLALLEILMLLAVNWFKFCTLGTVIGCVLAQLDVCLDM